MSARWTIGDAGLPDLERIAAFISVAVRPGDAIALTGELGTGKTTFARLLVGKIAGNSDEEVSSPTFALVQRYETARMPVTHADCYRLSSSQEAEELGFDEALEEGLLLVEWPEKVSPLLPPDRLEISFVDAGSDASRDISLKGHGAWAARLERLKAMVGFCDLSGWGDAQVSYLQGDASARAYARLSSLVRNVILMDAPRAPDGPPVKDGLPYSAIAHLAEDVAPFVAVATALRAEGLSAPEIFAHDLEQGFLILEDLGDGVFGPEIAKGEDEKQLYTAAADVLVKLSNSTVPERLPLPGGGSHNLPAYDIQALQIETELLLDWLWPYLKGEETPVEIRNEFFTTWQPFLEQAASVTDYWVLRDYHSPNLIWLPDRKGVGQVGIIDFQDAVRGSAAYDLVSLTQDARRDISVTLEKALFDHYCSARAESDENFDADTFGRDYAILGAQRNTKILGIFARLAVRDGKPGYLAHIPRVSDYLERNLGHSDLAPLRQWYDRYLPSSAREKVR